MLCHLSRIFSAGIVVACCSVWPKVTPLFFSFFVFSSRFLSFPVFSCLFFFLLPLTLTSLFFFLPAPFDANEPFLLLLLAPFDPHQSTVLPVLFYCLTPMDISLVPFAPFDPITLSFFVFELTLINRLFLLLCLTQLNLFVLVMAPFDPKQSLLCFLAVTQIALSSFSADLPGQDFWERVFQGWKTLLRVQHTLPLYFGHQRLWIIRWCQNGSLITYRNGRKCENTIVTIDISTRSS